MTTRTLTQGVTEFESGHRPMLDFLAVHPHFGSEMPAELLHYEQRGTGEPVLLLHGFLGAGRNLGSLVRRWCRRRPDLRLVVPDLTGHGFSPPLSEAPNLGELAGDVLALVARVSERPDIAIVGHSLGGRVALAALAADPSRIRSVTLLDIAPGPMSAGSGLSQLLEAVRAAPDAADDRRSIHHHLTEVGLAPALADWAVLNLEQGDDGVCRWRVDRERLALLQAAQAREDLWPVVERYPERVHCVCGDRSGFVGDDAIARFEQVGAKVTRIADSGHFLHVDQPEALVEVLAQGVSPKRT